MVGPVIYNTAIQLYRAGVALAAATGNGKARLWLDGRRQWQEKLRQAVQLQGTGPLVWVHAASLGEFEQGRPVLEALRRQFPGCRILLTFFSPSGYEVRKRYPGADYVCYLPLDTPGNARAFLEIIQPKLAIFIKYEFWYHFLTELYSRRIPTLLISGIFRPGQLFFRPYGGMFRRLLQQFTWIFVQNGETQALLQQAGIRQVAVAGDTRFDRVWALREEAAPLPFIERFTVGRKAVIAGSTWESDEQPLAVWWAQHPRPDCCLVIAPHEVHEGHIRQLLQLFPGAVRYTEVSNAPSLPVSPVLIIDNVGMLAALYRYAYVAYVGGGFRKDGIHNVLEPAAYDNPVLFGPVFHKYPEAAALLAAGGGVSVKDGTALAQQMERFLQDAFLNQRTGLQAGRYVAANKGATDKILAYIQEKRFLTSE